MSSDLRRWLFDTAERAGKTFVQAYLAVWFVAGADFDNLFTRDNLEGGVVGLALALAAAIGAKRLGAPDSASFLPAEVDPPQERGAVSAATACFIVIAVVLVLWAFGELPR